MVSAFLADPFGSVGMARASNKGRGGLGRSVSLLLLPICAQFVVLQFVTWWLVRGRCVTSFWKHWAVLTMRVVGINWRGFFFSPVCNSCAGLLYVFLAHVWGLKCLILYCDYLDDGSGLICIYIFMELCTVFRIGVKAVFHIFGKQHFWGLWNAFTCFVLLNLRSKIELQ